MMAKPIPPHTEISPSKFEAITPSQFIQFTVPNTLNHRLMLDDPVIRVSVCDSPLANTNDESPVIAAMIVPKNREADWYYTTEFGHMQLLFKFRHVSRLILIGNKPPPNPGPNIYRRPSVTDTEEQERVQNELKPLLMPLHPKVSSKNGLAETLFLTDEDDVVYRATYFYFLGLTVGVFLVEDVELEGNTQRRRRMRFRTMPYLVQSEALLVPINGDDEGTTQITNIENEKFEADTSVLVQQYLIAMVSGLFLISSYLNSLAIPRALCLGVGGGVLLNFLNTQLGFQVTGVEADPVVLDAAKKHFGLNKSDCIRLIVGDAIKTVQNFPPTIPKRNIDSKFDVIFVDLYSSEAKNGFSAPPPEFVKKPVFESVRSLLDVGGVVIMNVVHLNEVFYATLVKELKEVFGKVYEIDVGNKENFVVMATVSPTSSDDNDGDNEFLKKLKSVVHGTYEDSIVEL